MALVWHKQETKRMTPHRGPQHRTKVLSIISNKGGVGKSHFAINVSLALSRMGKKVLLVDSDLSSGTTGAKLGLFPNRALKDMLVDGVQFADLIVPTRFPGLHFIGGSSGDFDLANMNSVQKQRFIDSYMMLAREGRHHYMVLDLGASIEKKVIDFALSSHQVIIITTPQDVVSGYGCLKGSFIRFIQLAMRSNGAAQGKQVFNPLIVVNQIRRKDQGWLVYNVMTNLIRETTEEILMHLGQPNGTFSVTPSFLGEIPYVRDTLIKAEMSRKAVIELFPRSGATIAYNSLARELLKLAGVSAPTQPRVEFLKEWASDRLEKQFE